MLHALLIGIFVGIPVQGLDCYHGRSFDKDMKENVAGVKFEDTIEVRHCSTNETCCLKLAASKCCTLKARKYSIADGSCATTEICENADRRAELCSLYEAYECKSHVCRSHLCNELSAYDITNAAWHMQPETFLLMLFSLIAIQIIFFTIYLMTNPSDGLAGSLWYRL